MYKVSQYMFTKHQSRRRALILMTPTQHPCCSCSLTPFYAHTLVYMAYIYTHTLKCHLHFFSHLFLLYLPFSYPLQSLRQQWWFTLWITVGYLKVSAHMPLSYPPFSYYPSLSLSLFLATLSPSCFSFSFQSFSPRQIGFVCTPHQRERGAKI